MQIDAMLVRSLLREQFSQWAHLEVRPIEPQGWDNRSFRVGEHLVARLPSDAAYSSQVDREWRYLPALAPRLPLAIPQPAARGNPGCGYPWNWLVNDWIEGETATDKAGVALANALASFLAALHRIDTKGGPPPGAHNFHRGGDLRAYDDELSRSLAILEGRVDDRAARRLWKEAIATSWSADPVWVHGDISPGNVLVRGGEPVAVIDFGNLAVGDPACDLAIAWAWFDDDARRSFRSSLPLDDATWMRARAWALWKALIVAAGLSRTNAVEYADPLAVVARCLPGKSSRPAPR